MLVFIVFYINLRCYEHVLRSLVNESGGPQTKKKQTFKKAKKVVEKVIDDSPEEDFEDEDDNGFGDSEDGFDDMEEIPLDITEAVSTVKKSAKPTSKPQTKPPAKVVRAQYISTSNSGLQSFLIRKLKK